jgi:hypothetical protein
MCGVPGIVVPPRCQTHCPALVPRAENGQQSAPGDGFTQRAPVLRAERASQSAASLRRTSAPCATRSSLCVPLNNGCVNRMGLGVSSSSCSGSPCAPGQACWSDTPSPVSSPATASPRQLSASSEPAGSDETGYWHWAGAVRQRRAPRPWRPQPAPQRWRADAGLSNDSSLPPIAVVARCRCGCIRTVPIARTGLLRCAYVASMASPSFGLLLDRAACADASRCATLCVIRGPWRQPPGGARRLLAPWHAATAGQQICVPPSSISSVATHS